MHIPTKNLLTRENRYTILVADFKISCVIKL